MWQRHNPYLGLESQRIRRTIEGSQSVIMEETRSTFPGLGGVLSISRPITVAHRQYNNPQPHDGDIIYLRHSLAYLLELYFLSQGSYKRRHIPLPLGSISVPGREPQEGYIMDWVKGFTTFPWNARSLSGPLIYTLEELTEVDKMFSYSGAKFSFETYDRALDAAKHIILAPSEVPDVVFDMRGNWFRVDFSQRSFPWDYAQLKKFLDAEQEQIKKTPGGRTHKLMSLIAECLCLQNPEEMSRVDSRELEELIKQFRVDTLQKAMLNRNFDNVSVSVAETVY